MKTPAICRDTRCRLGRETPRPHSRERGVTMLLVAASMVAIIAMAALSIDVVTLYLAREEAQRAADTAALAAARVISVSGITGTQDTGTDTTSWALICGPTGTATLAAQAVGIQNSVGQISGTTTVTYSAPGGSSGSDCSALPQAFAVNPMVTVQVSRTSMPTFFSRIWGNRGNNVSATATAEAYNPSDSGAVSGTITPVLPSCVKPFVVPNQDPLNPAGCSSTTCHSFVSTTDGSITNPGISLNGSSSGGVVGETFWLVLDCQHGNPTNCTLHGTAPGVQPQANYSSGARWVKGPPNLLYVPGQVGTPVVAAPRCAYGDSSDPYQSAIEGCDESTNYQCGEQPPNNNAVDLTRNPDTAGTTTGGVQCLIGQTDDTNIAASSGQDYFDVFGAPSVYPYEILAGSSNPIASLSGKTISSSNSIVSLPIYDSTAVTNIASNSTTGVTFIGFLQVFINAVDQYGNINVTVLNVSGCSNGAPGNTYAVGNNPALGTSPVPVRLITPP